MKAKNVIGIDIGGTKIRVGRVNSAHKIIDSVRVSTESGKGGAAVLKNVVSAVQKVWHKDVGAIGVGIAGLVDHKKGVFLGGPNLPKALRGAKIAALLEKAFKVPVKVDNDVHCFTLAEARVGSGKGKNLVVGLNFGTGIGGGIAVQGNLLRGRNNAAGEFGHASVAFGAQNLCGCGRAGHFEAFASGRAMSRVYQTLTGKVLEPLDVQHAAEKGDRHAKQTLDLMANAMVAGLSSVIHALNPDIIVVGGGLSAVQALWKPVMARLSSQITFPELRTTPVRRSKLGTDANIIGATLLFEESR